jgi:subtilisin family serine protease
MAVEDVPPPATYELQHADFTGRYLVLLPQQDSAKARRTLENSAGLSVSSTEDFAGTADVESLGGAEAMVFANLGVAVVDADPSKTHAMLSAASLEGTDSMIVERERYVYPLNGSEYLRGYQDAVEDLRRRLSAGPTGGLDAGAGGRGGAGFWQPAPFAPVDARPPTHYQPGPARPSDLDEFFDTAAFTWGLQATGVDRTTRTGAGILVAVLDTGLDLTHPDFQGRAITQLSFVNGETVQDVLGHGTHCIGTACGPRTVPTAGTRRYGIAWQAGIVAGKIFDQVTRRAPDARILAGIAEAVRQRCAVVSMSLGAPTTVGQAFNAVMEQAAARALAAGTLIIAAAGNDSRRPDVIQPVSHPANCPSIMAVAAVDSKMRVAFFSNATRNPEGGKVDICGPGVNVFSTWPLPTQYRAIDGTSMATPHVAGCAALHAEESGLRGGALWARLVSTAKTLPLPASDVGSGLVQAP